MIAPDGAVSGNGDARQAQLPVARVLVVDDEDAIRAMLVDVLRDAGYAVTGVASGEEALVLIDGSCGGQRAGAVPRAGADVLRPHVVLLDLRLKGMSGADFVEEYRRRPGPHAPIVVVTALRGLDWAVQRIRPAGVVEKPFELRALLREIERVLAGN